MTSFNFAEMMGEGDFAEAQATVETFNQDVAGAKLRTGLAIGALLLKGSALAAEVTGEKVGKSYSAAFGAFKTEVGFKLFNDPTEQRQANQLYDDALYCAKNSLEAEQILAHLGVKWRANNGVSGLAKRVRAELKRQENVAKGLPPEGVKAAKAKPKGEVEGLRAELAETQAAYDGSRDEVAELKASLNTIKSGASSLDLSADSATRVVADLGVDAAKAFIELLAAAIRTAEAAAAEAAAPSVLDDSKARAAKIAEIAAGDDEDLPAAPSSSSPGWTKVMLKAKVAPKTAAKKIKAKKTKAKKALA